MPAIAALLFSATILYAMPPHPGKLLDTNIRAEPLVQTDGSDRVQVLQQKSFPSTGDHHILVLLVPFADISFAPVSTGAYYLDLFEGTASGTGLTWRKYYQDMSNDLLNLEFTVLTVSASPEAASYYGGNMGSNGPDRRPEELVTWAIESAIEEHDYIDFSVFDNDDDGRVDTVAIVHAGIGEEAAGSGDTDENPDAIWSHHWDLESAGIETLPATDNVEFYDYIIQPEFVFSAGDSTIGVFVHEFGHALGLPDLYDTTYETDGIGDWGLMGTGAWLGPDDMGDVPAPLSAWSRMFLGWLEVDDVTEELSARMVTPTIASVQQANPASVSGSQIQVNAGTPNAVRLPALTHGTTVNRKMPRELIPGMMVILACLIVYTRSSRLRKRRSFRPAILVVFSFAAFLVGCAVQMYYTIEAEITPDDAGVIADSLGAPFLPDAGGYIPGTQISLEAVPATGFDFVEWQGNATADDSTLSFTVSENISVVAIFQRIEYILETGVSPIAGGIVTVSANGTLYYGDQIVVTATPNAGYQFSSWSGSLISNKNPVVIDVSADIDLTALFTEIVLPSYEHRYEITDLESSYRALRVSLDSVDETEYLILANVVKTPGTWTEFLPGEGIIVLHIDEEIVDENLDSNDVNDGEIHGVAVIEADGNDSLWQVEEPTEDTGNASDLFASPDRAELVYPHMNDGTPSDKRIENISLPGTVMTADILTESG